MTAMYLKEMVDKDVSISAGTPVAGDIYFVTGDNEELGEEGYEMEIGDILTVTAPETKGALYAGASITQIL